MKELVETIFNVMFPPRDESGFFISWKLSDYSNKLTKAPTHEKFSSLFSYKDPLVKKLIRSFKYEKIDSIGKHIAVLLADEILNQFVDDAIDRSDKILIIPIPISKQRMKERGFNQIGWIAKKVAHELGGSFIYKDDLLLKIKHTKKQSTLKRSERLSNPKGSFAVHKKIKNKKVILIDDVITTGATVNEAKRALKEAGVKHIEILCIAH